MVTRNEGFTYPGIPVDTYKDEPGTWSSVTRRVLAAGSATQFEARYFEIAPGGYTSFERHAHEHVVVILRGRGEVRLGAERAIVDPNDVVRVVSQTPHQFLNVGDEPFGLLCIVDRDRDRPVLLQDDGTVRASE